MEGIKGKVVVITGASSGIGEATALMLAERGAKVVLGATGSDRLKAVAEAVKARVFHGRRKLRKTLRRYEPAVA